MEIVQWVQNFAFWGDPQKYHNLISVPAKNMVTLIQNSCCSYTCTCTLSKCKFCQSTLYLHGLGRRMLYMYMYMHVHICFHMYCTLYVTAILFRFCSLSLSLYHSLFLFLLHSSLIPSPPSPGFRGKVPGSTLSV